MVATGGESCPCILPLFLCHSKLWQGLFAEAGGAACGIYVLGGKWKPPVLEGSGVLWVQNDTCVFVYEIKAATSVYIK